jgi:serine/threonine-protein phosphatase 6 regulatory ankyrin repeat subunit A
MYSEFIDDLILLEIDESASISDLKQAYRELAKVWHPDRFKDDPKLTEKASKKLTEINAAYERLQKHFQSRRHTSSTPPPRSEEQTEAKQNPEASKKHYHEDSILHRLFSLFFWITVWGGVCLLTGATIMLGFSTEPKPTHIIENIVLLFLGICASPVLLLAVYRTFLYIVYGSKVTFKFKKLWLVAFLPTLLFIVFIIIGYLLTIFGDSKGAQITRLKQKQSVTPIIEQRKEQSISQKSKKASTVTKPTISIRDAARVGNIEAVKQHLSAGTDVNSTDTIGYTALDIAIAKKQTEIARILRQYGGISGAELSIYIACDLGNIGAIKKHIIDGVNLNLNDDWELSPLAYASSSNHKDITDKEIAKLLLTNGADVNHKLGGGLTALHKAAGPGSSELVELLISYGANVNAEPEYLGNDISIWHLENRTPLDQAIKSNSSNTALLRKHGGKTYEELHVLHVAIKKGDTKAVKQHLSVGADVNDKTAEGTTPLHLVAIAGYKEIVELLIANGADVNVKRDDGNTPLDNATKYEHTNIIELLRKHGGKTSAELKAAYSNENLSNSTTSEPEPPETSIWDAALDGNNEAIKQHLAAGTDVNVQKIGESALSYASLSGQAKTVELLIRSGADVNTRNNGNSTPLFHAAEVRHTDVVKLLIVNGAEVNAINDKGETPLDSAESAKAWGPGKNETIALLRKHGGKTGSELKPPYSIFEAAMYGDIETVKQHLNSGTDVGAKDSSGVTSLHVAAVSGNTEIAELLIAKGADVNAKGILGWTPLFTAAGEGHMKIVELLIAKDADVNAKSDDGRTPLDRAKRHPKTADLLRKHGGKTGTEVKQTYSIFEAAKKNLVDTVKHKLSGGVDINSKDDDGFTALHWAVYRSHKDLIESLIDKGANINAKDIFGKTPLDYADGDIPQLLRNHGARTREQLKQ